MAWLQVTNNARTTLESTISAGAGSLTLHNNESLFPTTGDNFRLTIWSSQYTTPGDDPGMEIVECTARSGTAVTIGTRGVEGTSASQHVAGDYVALLITKGHIDELRDYIEANAVAGPTGATGATGDAGPNEVTSSTSTDITGYFYGDGADISGKDISTIKTELSLTRSDVGLGNVDNTSDSTKNAASVTLTNKTINNATLTGGVTGNAIDTDGTLGANSDTLLASQKAIKTYADTKLTTGTANGLYAPISKGVTNGDSHNHSGGDGAQISWVDLSFTSSDLNDIEVKSHNSLNDIGTYTHPQIDSHIDDTTNPHDVTKSQLGLGNVDNTSDLAKPISTATQTALDLKLDSSSTTDDIIEGATNKYNITHTGEVTGATSLTVDKTVITNRSTVSVSPSDLVLIADASDSNNLKKVLASDLAGGGSGGISEELAIAYSIAL